MLTGIFETHIGIPSWNLFFFYYNLVLMGWIDKHLYHERVSASRLEFEYSNFLWEIENVSKLQTYWLTLCLIFKNANKDQVPRDRTRFIAVLIMSYVFEKKFKFIAKSKERMIFHWANNFNFLNKQFILNTLWKNLRRCKCKYFRANIL